MGKGVGMVRFPCGQGRGQTRVGGVIVFHVNGGERGLGGVEPYVTCDCPMASWTVVTWRLPCD